MTQFLSAFIIIFFSFNAFSNDTFTRCTNGSIEVVGDGFFVADFHKDSVDFQIYEGFVSFNDYEVQESAAYGKKSTTFTVSDRTKNYYVEGEIEKRTFDAIMLLSGDKKIAKVAYSMNKESFRSLDLTCKKVKYQK